MKGWLERKPTFCRSHEKGDAGDKLLLVLCGIECLEHLDFLSQLVDLLQVILLLETQSVHSLAQRTVAEEAMYVCDYLYICVCVYLYIRTRVCIYIHRWVRACVYLYIRVGARA